MANSSAADTTAIDIGGEIERKWLARVPRNAAVGNDDVSTASFVDGSRISRSKRPTRADERTTTVAFLDRWGGRTRTDRYLSALSRPVGRAGGERPGGECAERECCAEDGGP